MLGSEKERILLNIFHIWATRGSICLKPDGQYFMKTQLIILWLVLIKMETPQLWCTSRAPWCWVPLPESRYVTHCYSDSVCCTVEVVHNVCLTNPWRHRHKQSPAYEPAMDLWFNTNAMEISSTYSPSLTLNLSKKNFNCKINKLKDPFRASPKIHPFRSPALSQFIIFNIKILFWKI